MLKNPVIAALRRHAQRQGEVVALRDNYAALTYSELAAAVHSLANWIRGEDCQCIALDCGSGIAWAIADLAAMDADVSLVPLPGFFTDEQVHHALTTAKVDRVLADRDHLARWSLLPGVSVMQGLTAFVLEQDLRQASALLPSCGCKITFTSGSTGTPRGVVLTNETLATCAEGIVRALSPLKPRRHLSVLPLATLLENIAGLYAPLLHGSEVFLPDERSTGLTGASLDIERFAALLDGAQADSIILVPQLLMTLVTLVELGLVALPSLQMIAVGGGRVSHQLLERSAALGLPVCEGYGLSECASVLTLNLPGASRMGSVGRPLSHSRIRVDEHGEILVRTPRMVGYLGVEPGDSDWYSTGDLGHFDDDGFLYIDGRRRNVFITSYGRNVNPEWPEAALTQHPAVAQALVWGEAQPHNLALLWLRYSQDEEQVSQLVDTANAELPDYARIHQWIVVEGLPDTELQTSNGRLRRSAVLTRYGALINEHYDRHVSDFSYYERRRHAVL